MHVVSEDHAINKDRRARVKYFGFTQLEAIRSATMEGERALRMEGKVGAIKEGYEADIIFVNGRAETDVTLLGETDNITRVMISGVEKNLAPLPVRKPLSGWRLASMGKRLTRDYMAMVSPNPEEPFDPEELH